MVDIALIPAGGRGIALLPATRAFPKELYPFGGKPVIEHVIEGVKACGIKKIIFVAGYKKSALLDYIGDGSLFNIEASFVYQEKPTGPGDAILCGNLAIKKNHTNFLVCFGDNIVMPQTQIRKLIDIHLEHQPLASALVFPTTKPTRYGIVQIKTINKIARIVDIVEKPRSREEQDRLKTASGKFLALSSVMVFNIRIFEYLKQISPDKDNRYQIADALRKAIEQGEQIIAYHLSGQLIDVSSWDFLWALREYFRNLSDEQLTEIIKERNSKMKMLLPDVKLNS